MTVVLSYYWSFRHDLERLVFLNIFSPEVFVTTSEYSLPLVLNYSSIHLNIVVLLPMTLNIVPLFPSMGELSVI